MRFSPTHSTHRGFSLVEITIAIGIAAFSLTAVMSLFSAMLGTEQSAIVQTSIPALTHSILHTVNVSQNQQAITEPTTFHFSQEGKVATTPVAAGYSCEVTPMPLDAANPNTGVTLFRLNIRRADSSHTLRTVYATLRHE